MMCSALFRKFGSLRAFGFVFCAICVRPLSGSFGAGAGFGGSGDPEPARAASAVSPREGLG